MIEVIEKHPPPWDVRGIHNFLGHTVFYRHFIKEFSKFAKPLTDLLQIDVAFIGDDACLREFETLKTALISAPIIQPPNWEVPFKIMCDASDYAIGAA
ncbi:unnamed protein product [Rhodiola kirilowii]